jgi:oligoendopeptidase F
MGHSFHTKLSDTQPYIYKDYTIATAEVASTLFENFVFDEMFSKMSKKEKIVALHNKINDSITTIFRQIACFNFEKELHETVREKGGMSKEEIAVLLNKHMQAYLGPVFKLEKDDGYSFVSWMHLRRFFYVYSYAFGALISDALYLMYKKDKNFEIKIREFMSAGGSASPEDIFGSIGIDIRNPKFFELGLKKIEKDIEELERLTESV